MSSRQDLKGHSHTGALLLCIGVPLVLLLLSYLWLALSRGTLALWNAPVHESGRYTLQETVFYFSHFLREIPINVNYALFLLAGFARAGGLGLNEAVHRRRATALAKGALGAALLLVALAFLSAAQTQGWTSALYDLLQFRTRDDLFAYGSHWRFHWLSTLWFGAAALLLSAPLTRLVGTPAPDVQRLSRRVKWIAWGYFALLTVLFGLSTEVFTDVRYAGHQAREILTHGPITGPLGFGALYLAANWLLHPDAWKPRGEQAAAQESVKWHRSALFLVVPAYLTVVTLSGNVMEAGQAEQGLAAMVAGHVFEHVLDYLFVVLLCLGGYGGLLAWRKQEVQFQS